MTTLKDFAQLRTFKEIEAMSGSKAFTASRLQERVREAVDIRVLHEREGKRPPQYVEKLLHCVVMDGRRSKRIHLGRWEQFIKWQMDRPVR